MDSQTCATAPAEEPSGRDIRQPVHRALTLLPEQVLGRGGLCERRLEGFREREGQLKVTCAISRSIEEGTLLLAEAGTGTGKTFAYLIPALISGHTVIVSTAGKALQDQLLHKDLPVVFKLLGLPRDDYAVLKGRSNYLCLNKLYRAQDELHAQQRRGSLNFDDEAVSADTAYLNERQLDELFEFARIRISQVQSGDPECDFADLSARVNARVQARLGSDRLTCRGKKCSQRGNCFYYAARVRALAARVVVVNHALFFEDLHLVDHFSKEPEKPLLLPNYGTIIFDEAHELPDCGRSHLTQQLSSAQVQRVLNDLQALLKEEREALTGAALEARAQVLECLMALDWYFEDYRGTRHNILFHRYEDYDEDKATPLTRFEQPKERFLSLCRLLYRSLHDLENQLFELVQSRGEDLYGAMFDEVALFRETLVGLMRCDDPKSKYYGTYVGTAEVGKKGFELKLIPLEIAGEFGTYLRKAREQRVAVIMTSATLTVKGRFDKLRLDLGIEKRQYQSVIAPSPFDYRRNCALYCSDRFPLTDDPHRERGIVESLSELMCAMQGGIFFLTTSRQALQKAAAALRELFGTSREVFCQYEGLSNQTMLERFKERGNAVLVGTSSFWAGVDVPGQALCLVIIDKLPFTSPGDPLFAMRCRSYELRQTQPGSPRSSFRALALPEAVIELKQGVGRLIRHEHDCGALVICDPRISSKGYGSTFLNSLPEMHRCNSLAELMEFSKNMGLFTPKTAVF